MPPSATNKLRPRFSLLLPTRNSLPYVKEQVASILAQSGSDWEVIAVDGMSTDGTWEYLCSLAANDPRFAIFQALPKGVYAGLNECIRRSSGEWVLFTMSDDTLLPGCLESIRREVAEPYESDVIHFKIKIIDENGNDSAYRWDERLAVGYWGEEINRRHWRDGSQEYWRHVLYGSVYISLTELAVRREYLITAPLFDELVGPWADILWAARLVRAGRIQHLPQVLATWRLRKGQTTQIQDKSASPRNHLALIDKLMGEEKSPAERNRYLEYRAFAERYYRYIGVLGGKGRVWRRLRDPRFLLREILEWVLTGKLGASSYHTQELRVKIPVT